MKSQFFVLLMATTLPYLAAGQTAGAQSEYDRLLDDLSHDRLEQREQEKVAKRLAQTNDPEIIRRLILTTSQNSEENGDNRIIEGLSYSRDPQVREFMINIIMVED